MTDEVPMDRLAKVYIKIRTKIAELTKDYESQVEALKVQQDELTSVMKTQLQALGGKAVKTDYGTVSLVTKTRYFAQDWELMAQFIMEHNAIDLLEKRIAQTNMAKYLEENPTAPPPGLQVMSEIQVSVRKPTK